MSWSKVAFGAAKCAKGVAEHEAAFTRALKAGITGGGYGDTETRQGQYKWDRLLTCFTLLP